ncbi:VOC family protein [Amycolatopsis endophytica]|uniref:Catechol 2,3-dioxygenase-like lactoylglutathione lyase family enzyme n=1 Tax=Amycolatopsis endophytica TaxID=860233 RepID=A0A853BAM3_9PSEU|nr:VOC family protein [Amycolatopsis endophytica]NYI92219.1 catechol 2,3-dioxygenase-like lactoylglutathione lyase family enzyme [Amycolatopsis endophytica]
MITGLSHSSVYVLDQDSAKAFYTEKLGFELRQDLRLGDFRWLTVGPPGQPGLDFILMKPGPPQHDAETEKQIRELVAKGALGGGVWQTRDCREAHAELSARGVTFLQEPAERPYGVEAVFRDDSGNWFSLTQRHEFDPGKDWA